VIFIKLFLIIQNWLYSANILYTSSCWHPFDDDDDDYDK